MSAWWAAMHAVLHSPSLASYMARPDLVDADISPKRINACAVLAAVRDKNVGMLEDALKRYTKTCARQGPVDVHTIIAKILAAMHEATHGIAKVLEDEAVDPWAPDQPWSMILEIFGFCHGTPPSVSFTLSIPVAGTSLARSFREHAERDPVLRYPPSAVFHLKRAPKHMGFVDYTLEFDIGHGIEYRLCAVVCHGDAGWYVMADAGYEKAWIRYDDGVSVEIMDMNAIITKDAHVLVYKKKRFLT